MYGWPIFSLLVCAILPTPHPALATGSVLTHSILPVVEDPQKRSANENCTEDDAATTVNCRKNSDMCCSFSVHNSSHFRHPCAIANDMSSMRFHHHHNRTSSDCTLRIPAASDNCSSGDTNVLVHELVSCAGTSLSVICEYQTECQERGATWRRLGGPILSGRRLRLRNAQRGDSGTYHCEAMTRNGTRRLVAQLNLAIQFPPVMLVPNFPTSFAETGEQDLKCSSEASPAARIFWFMDDVLLDSNSYPGRYAISSETADCTTRSLLRLREERNSTQNITCVALNAHGNAFFTLLIAADDEVVPSQQRRRFNVTGFIVGMLPPLFISFYIILKLGYRSRYAEERGEDDGYRDEPFFISY